jgi:hypothetical protein
VSALRSGERAAAGGAIALLLLLCLDWFSLDVALPLPGLHQSGWASLGWPMVVLLLAVVVTVTAQILATIRAPLEQQLRAGVATVAISTLVAPVLILRVVLFQPGLGVGAPNAAVSVLAPAYLGILAELVIVAGAWYALADERTDAPQSAYEPPAPRPAPPSAEI